jgi:UDP-GlcNAc:undecaprenyl-phosphate GlcNAc-1-phosphate transferase
MVSTAVLIVALGIGFGLPFLFLARRTALAVGLVDRPDGRRKVHKKPVAVVGGVGVFVAAVIAVLFAAAFDQDVRTALDMNSRPAVWLLLAAAVVVALGVADDRYNLRARFKLLGQIFAILLAVVGGGYVIDRVVVFGQPVEFGVFAVPVTALWFLAAVNALNLLDGMDGMLGTLGLVITASLGVMAAAAGHPLPAAVAFALAGSLIAFLWFNKPPASVYLGDAGSMLIGLTVAALSIKAAVKGPTAAVGILAPAGLLVLPLLDTAAAVIRRGLTGRGLAVADRGHLHHLLLKRGWSVYRSLAVVGGLALVAAIGAIGSAYLENDLIAVIGAGAVVAVLLVGGLFGVAEARLLASRAASAVTTSVTRPANVEMEVRLQGTAEWETVWGEIAGRADDLALTAVYLDVNAPVWHEGYHRRWVRRGHRADELTGWRVDLPLVGHGQVLGRLTVCGDRGGACIGDRLRAVSEMAKSAEQLAVLATLPAATATAKAAEADSTSVPRSPRPPAAKVGSGPLPQSA